MSSTRHLIISLWLLTLTVSAQQGIVENKEYGFRIALTNGWSQLPLPKDQPNVVLLAGSHYEHEKADYTLEDCRLYVKVVPAKGRTLDQVIPAFRQDIEKRLEGKIESQENVQVGGYPAVVFRYHGEPLNQNGQPVLGADPRYGMDEYKRMIIQRGDRFYIVHSAAQSKEFKTHYGDIDNMFHSFTFVGGP